MGRLARTKSKTRSATTVLAALSLLGSLAAPSGAYPRPGTIERVTIGFDGREAIGETFWPFHPASSRVSISTNGRFIAFTSNATNLVLGDTNLVSDVFVYDRRMGSTERVSVSSDGTQAIGAALSASLVGSHSASISGSGRYVVFLSYAVNLVKNDTNLVQDVFIHDRRTGRIERINVSSEGKQADGEAVRAPSVSRSGRLVAFDSKATNLVPDDTNGESDVFLHDRKTGKTIRISLTDQDAEAQAGSVCPSISADGRVVAFQSEGALVRDDTNQFSDVFVRDLAANRTERVSVATDGSEALLVVPASSTCGAGVQTLSSDGRYVAFISHAWDLIPNDTNTEWDSFVHDRKTGRTERISISSDGSVEGDSTSNRASIGPNGRYVTFSSFATNFFPGDSGTETHANSLTQVRTTGDWDPFIYDRRSGTLELLSVSPDGTEAKGCGLVDGVVGEASSSGTSLQPAMDGNARYVAFHSCADNLVTGDTNKVWDVFARDRGSQLGTGGFGGSPPKKDDPPDDRICIDQIDLCIPPGAAVSSHDSTDDLDDVLTKQGANLYGASLAYRPQYEDLFAAIELEHMPQVLPGVSPIFYGLRFEVGDRSYEVRATSLLGGTFGLFDCGSSRPACTKVADLRGGYGTTGMRVVFSLPLEEIELEDGGELWNVEAFSAFGSYLTGPAKILDRASLN